jgi:hypothetical protein
VKSLIVSIAVALVVVAAVDIARVRLAHPSAREHTTRVVMLAPDAASRWWPAASGARAGVVSHARVTRPRPRIPLIWRRLAFCESTNRWHIVNPPYSGGLQFTASTWTSFDTKHYAPTADQATRWEQVQVARHVLRVQGVGAWPVCGPKVRLRVAVVR